MAGFFWIATPTCAAWLSSDRPASQWLPTRGHTWHLDSLQYMVRSIR